MLVFRCISIGIRMFSLWQFQGDRIHGTFWAARSGRLGATATTRSRSSPGPGGATSQGCNRFGCWPHWNHRLLDGLYLNQFKRRSLIKANCSQTFLSHSWSGYTFFLKTNLKHSIILKFASITHQSHSYSSKAQKLIQWRSVETGLLRKSQRYLSLPSVNLFGRSVQKLQMIAVLRGMRFLSTVSVTCNRQRPPLTSFPKCC